MLSLVEVVVVWWLWQLIVTPLRLAQTETLRTRSIAVLVVFVVVVVVACCSALGGVLFRSWCAEK